MRLFELFDKPLDYELMGTNVDHNHGEKDYTFGFRVDDYWYKVYISFYPMMQLVDDEDISDDVIPPEFVERAKMHQLIMSIDFSQFDYGTMVIPRRGAVPIGKGEERTGREGTGNELQVFATVAHIAEQMFREHQSYIGAIEYGAKQIDPNRKRLYNTLMRKFGVSGTKFEYEDITDVEGQLQDRVVIVL